MTQKKRITIVAGLLGMAGLMGCMRTPDLGAVKAEAARPVQRYDITQALATNGDVVVAGTQSGAALISGDHGQTWKRTPLGNVSLIGLDVCPDKTFIGIDFYHKLWTADAKGEGWKPAALEKPRVPLAVTCDPKGRWWVSGSGAKIAVSADKGASWTVTDFGEDAQLTALQFIDENNGVAAGEFGIVVTTSDGGATWQKKARIPNDFYPYALLFTSRQEGWISGIAGQILHTADGGATWHKQENSALAPLYRLFLHDGKPYGVGAGGVIARLEGDTWRAMPYPDAAPVFLAAGASLGQQQAGVVIGGPGGLVRAVGTKAN